MQLKNIIFDFGGIFYSVDYLKTIDALASLSPRADMLKDLQYDEILDLPKEYEMGLITSNEFISGLRETYSILAPDEEIMNAWNAMLMGLKPDAEYVAAELARQYNIVLLSNTNEIHYNYFIDEVQGLLKHFADTFFSFQIGMRKPDEKIYKFVCDKMNFSPSETLFVDDSIKNSSGATKIGLAFYHHSSNADLSELLHTIKLFTHN
jgi:putative hydrolase of the HAD superfamily